MVSLSFDTEDPPEQPPPGCADPLLWRVSVALHQEHRWYRGDRCSCGDRYPCDRGRLAERGLVISCTRRRYARNPAQAGVPPEVRPARLG
jgi:hypothetical protein